MVSLNGSGNGSMVCRSLGRNPTMPASERTWPGLPVDQTALRDYGAAAARNVAIAPTVAPVARR
jgi:hypothetical protein